MSWARHRISTYDQSPIISGSRPDLKIKRILALRLSTQNWDRSLEELTRSNSQIEKWVC